jgi:nitrous oxidase accessory protein NosD
MRTTELCGLAIGTVLVLSGGRPALAATLCVNPGGTGGCEATISAAVTAASTGDIIEVAPGTYAESVTIGKSIALVGTGGAEATIINAAGLGNGIYIDGIDTPHLAGVSVNGFTVENANFEGILVTNASNVAVIENNVIQNDLALVVTNGNGSCAGLPAFETLESDDCGEGIHLSGTDHAVVSGNFVNGNAGGILTSDDTGAARNNLILDNTVTANRFDCGITLASHPPASFTGAATPFGVFQNTVFNNFSKKNGTVAPFGAGVGLFTSVPGAATFSNLIGGNVVTGNGLPGVALHSHTKGQNLTNNAMMANVLAGNGPDNGDAATSGPTGINVYAVSPATGTIIAGNRISDESIDIAVKTVALVTVHFNKLLGDLVGVANLGTGPVDATNNWWGCAAGPPASGCSSVTGANVLTIPALTASP